MGSASSSSEDNRGKSDEILSVHSPALLDLDHGTIRHRDIARKKGNNDQLAPKTKTGYFYHPKLGDYSEDAVVNPEDAFKFYYVFKGPKKDQSKRLYYVYGTNMNTKDAGIKHESYKPQGKGYNWPESFRKANNLYYELIFLEQDPVASHYSDTMSLDSFVTFDSANTSSTQSKEMIRMVIQNDDTAEEIKRKLAVRLLVPAINIHVIFNKAELRLIKAFKSVYIGFGRRKAAFLDVVTPDEAQPGLRYSALSRKYCNRNENVTGVSLVKFGYSAKALSKQGFAKSKGYMAYEKTLRPRSWSTVKK